MYKNYKMTKHTLLMETSVLIPTNDISRHVNDIVVDHYYFIIHNYSIIVFTYL